MVEKSVMRRSTSLETTLSYGSYGVERSAAVSPHSSMRDLIDATRSRESCFESDPLRINHSSSRSTKYRHHRQTNSLPKGMMPMVYEDREKHYHTDSAQGHASAMSTIATLQSTQPSSCLTSSLSSNHNTVFRPEPYLSPKYSEIQSLRTPPLTLGDVYTNSNARKAYTNETLKSMEDSSDHHHNTKVSIIFMNQTQETLILCWVGFGGKLHHYYRLEPCKPTLITSLKNDEVNMSSKKGVHVERTYLGHSFVLGTLTNSKSVYGCEDDDEFHDIIYGCFGMKKPDTRLIDKSSKIVGTIIAGYRPRLLSLRKKDARGNENKEELNAHMVTITSQYALPPLSSREKGFFQSILPLASTPQIPKVMYQLTVTECKIDDAPLDTSAKIYDDMTLGGWKVKCEEGLFTTLDHDIHETMKKVKRRLEIDINAASKKLPAAACKFLKECTPIWINRTQRYGPKAAPIRGRGMCFHPDKNWLIENGMSSKKCGGVELFEASKYLKDCDLWHGKGGVILHELAHAYHNKCLEDGYRNKEVLECYNAAMDENLYDCVKVHCLDGDASKRKAYACTDAMEYFAELSVAFLGGVGKDKDVEFNKWFPFNRTQLKDHDPRAYEMLKKMWKVQ
mmetsp:Transcript_24716/g.30398  ORF Transcript_24716/g.30398 Transcript_24716/m.30398 type:complete len:621 (-) Transcript_24716:1175-3037(-)